MISYLCDVKSGLKKQVELSNKLELDNETLRSQMSEELSAWERKYQDLLQSSSDERETALAVEKSLREHYKQILM
jgi:regulator of replication initiation timing